MSRRKINGNSNTFANFNTLVTTHSLQYLVAHFKLSTMKLVTLLSFTLGLQSTFAVPFPAPADTSLAISDASLVARDTPLEAREAATPASIAADRAQARSDITNKFLQMQSQGVILGPVTGALTSLSGDVYVEHYTSGS